MKRPPKRSSTLAAGAVLLALLAPRLAAGQAYVNFETPQVHPMDLSPDGSTLAVVHTADNRLLLFDVTSGRPVARGSVTVGYDPVSVRFLSDSVAWVANHVSDSISVINVPARRIIATLPTADEPADVVFAGIPERAFVTCSQVNKVLVFDPADLRAAPLEVAIDAEEPRALAVSPDGLTVYAAVFESGNGTTSLLGGVPAQLVSVAGPYGGQNPPPNRGGRFEPPIRAGLPTPPLVGHIVRQGEDGRWRDDNGGDWSEFVSGARAGESARDVGWTLIDRDVAVIDTADLSVRYVPRLMNLVMALSVNPATGWIYAVGTDATNEVRFEPNLRGRFLRVHVARVHPRNFHTEVRDLNPHLTYDRPTVPQRDRDRSLGDPRVIVWNAAGSRAYVAGLGSNNVVVVSRLGQRVGEPIEVGEGPTGLVLDRVLDRLYVLNRFDASISVVDLGRRREIERVPFFDPTPDAVRKGRRHLYDTHRTSGLGHVSCASCHVDARLDRLAWDLGDPQGFVKDQDPANRISPNDNRFTAWHPMKGPMTTQTLRDTIGKEPFHWRGDRDGIEEFNGAFVSLLGDDTVLTRREMQEFEDYLATIHYPPNPFRNLDNSLPTDLPLPGFVRPGRFGRRGEPLPDGDAVRGLSLFRDPTRVKPCLPCHTLPVGKGSPQRLLADGTFEPVPPGPAGEQHTALQGAVTGLTQQRGVVVPQLRNLSERLGFTRLASGSLAGFGLFLDGTGFLEEFLAIDEQFDPASDQDIADVVALLLAFSGGFAPEPGDPPGSPSLDAHAAVGRQVTIGQPNQRGEDVAALLELAESGAVDLVVKAKLGGRERGWVYRKVSGRFQSDRRGEPALLPEALLALASPRSRLTLTVVPRGSGTRLGIDRDFDGVLDFDDRRLGR